MPGIRWSDDPEPRSDEDRARDVAAYARRAAVPNVIATTDALAVGALGERARALIAKAMHQIDASLDDRDERVRIVAARVAVQACPKVAELAPPDVPETTPAERDAALRAALESPEFAALLVRVVAVPESVARAALVAAGWEAP